MRFTEYESFKELEKHEAGKYLVVPPLRHTPIIVIAPHGKTIEPHTETIAQKIAGDTYSLYQFLGLRRRLKTDPGNGRKQSLHLSSTKFKEPTALKSVKASDFALAVHGLDNLVANEFGGFDVYVGGANGTARKKMVTALKAAGFNAVDCTGILGFRHKGIEAANIVNQCKGAGGVQFEITLRERKALSESEERMVRFSTAIRQVLNSI